MEMGICYDGPTILLDLHVGFDGAKGGLPECVSVVSSIKRKSVLYLFHFAEPWSLHSLRFPSFISFQAIPSPPPSPNRIPIHLLIPHHPSTSPFPNHTCPASCPTRLCEPIS